MSRPDPDRPPVDDAQGAPAFRPIIDDFRTSRSVHVRDVLLTLLAWAVLAWFLRDAWILFYALCEYLVGFRKALPAMHSDAIVDDLVPFFRLVLLFVLWLLLFASVHWRRLNSRRRAAGQPLPLEVERHAGHWELPAEQVLAQRSRKVVIARFDDKGRPAAFD